MKRAYWIRLIVLVLAVAVLTGTSAWATTKKAASQTDAAAKKKADAGKDGDDDPVVDKKKKDEPADEDVEINPDLTDFYAEVAEVTRLNEDGQKKLLVVQEKKNKALDNYDKKYGKLIVRIENEMDRTENQRRREKLQVELLKIEMNREKLQEQADTVALRVLNADQMVAWNTYELWSVLSPDFEGEDLELSDEQIEKSKAVCKQIAGKAGKNRIAKNPSAQKMAIAQIGRQVLTQKQREAYVRQQNRKRAHEKAETKTIMIETRQGRHH